MTWTHQVTAGGLVGAQIVALAHQFRIIDALAVWSLRRWPVR